MTRKLLTADEFRDSAKGGSRPDGMVLRLAVAEPEVVEGDSRKIRFIFSDGAVDRAGDSIDPMGWDTASFLKNPVALWAHDSYSPPIGRASDVAPVGGKLMGDIEFMPAEISAFADSIYRMVKGGYVKAVSVGFIPLEWTFVNDTKRPYGIDFKRQELLEISVCPVPCNPNALQEAKSAGIDTGPLREWASKVLDHGGHVLVPRSVLEETFRQAKTPRAVRQKFLAKPAAPEWKVGAADDLPVVDREDWDGAAAAKRMLDAAGFDGDSPDFAKAARGFLVHDSANPILRSSYKLPFADIVDGELKAVKSGIAAAKGRIDQAGLPVGTLDDAKEIADEYDQQEVSKTEDPSVHKAGRKISKANEALLMKAMDHHASASQCLQEVLDSNAAEEDPEDDAEAGDDPVVVTLSARERRLADAKALRESIGK